MANLKKGKWTPEEVIILKAIKKDGNQSVAIKKAAKTFKRPYVTTWQKWHSLGDSLPASTPVPKKDIPAMVIEFDPHYEPKKAGLDANEKESFIKGLEPKLGMLKPLKGALNIPSRFEKVAKEYFTKHHSQRYAVTSIKGTSKMKKVIQKY